MTETPNLGLPVIVAQQAMKHITHYESLIKLDTLTQLAVIDMAVTTPPLSPSAGDRYLIGQNPTADFVGKGGMIAFYDGASWRFAEPRAGWLLYNQRDAMFYSFDGTTWKKLVDLVNRLQNSAGLGIGTTYDGINRLAVKTNASFLSALTNAEGGTGDIRLSLNKPSSEKTVSLIYQTNWSGRAEIGLTGDDNFHVKVSANGGTWREALLVSAAAGSVRIDQILSGKAVADNAGKIECDFDGSTNSAVVLSDISNTSSSTALLFRKSGVMIGSIKLSSTGTSFVTVSDHRLKQNIGPILDGLDRVMKLVPHRYSFCHAPGLFCDGFLAHEVQDVVPEAVMGDRDAVDGRGEIVPQALDSTRLIPILVAAIQDLASRLARLESKI